MTHQPPGNSESNATVWYFPVAGPTIFGVYEKWMIVKTEMQRRKVRFLPKQVIRRVLAAHERQ
ncbi:MAG: hypothetical protein Q7S87_18080 [Agitococcus sp.]|nr:hypothetical protein [Agitococcus sp.]